MAFWLVAVEENTVVTTTPFAVQKRAEWSPPHSPMPEPALVVEGAAHYVIELGAGVVWSWASFSRGDFSRSRRFAAETS